MIQVYILSAATAATVGFALGFRVYTTRRSVSPSPELSASGHLTEQIEREYIEAVVSFIHHIRLLHSIFRVSPRIEAIKRGLPYVHLENARPSTTYTFKDPTGGDHNVEVEINDLELTHFFHNIDDIRVPCDSARFKASREVPGFSERLEQHRAALRSSRSLREHLHVHRKRLVAQALEIARSRASEGKWAVQY